MLNRNSKTKKKSIIDVYPTVYNVDLVVANKHTTIEQINKRYKTIDDKDFEDDDCICFT
jgi:hypothetical protein